MRLKKGWVRLWVVSIGLTYGAFLLYGYWFVMYQQSCFNIFTVTPISSFKVEDDVNIKNLRNGNDVVFCGVDISIELSELERLAAKGMITQVSFQWLEPSGWTGDEKKRIDVLNGAEIRAADIVSKANAYVRMARLRTLAEPAIIIGVVGLFVLMIGISIAWVRAGFKGT